jgi:hypothetical protein
LLPGYLHGQNLVPNPSFEDYDECPNDKLLTYHKFLVPDWYLATGATPDYFNSCARKQVGVPKNYMGYCFAKDGQAYAGLILLFAPPVDSLAPAKKNYREYIEAKLNSPLEKEKTYKFSFFYAIATYSTFAMNRLGIYISNDLILKKLSTGVLNYKPQIIMDTAVIVTGRDQWYEVSGNYTAKGGEAYITIGNFYNDRKTNYVEMDVSGMNKFMRYVIKENNRAYYYIDLVSVTKIDD